MRGRAEKTEVVQTLLADAESQLKMQAMVTQFASDVRTHYSIAD